MTESTTNLKVPFNEKDQAKSMGARWNAESKHWYVPQGVDVAAFEKWLIRSDTNPAQSASKPATKPNTENNPSFNDDLDTINAKLRDAYEPRDGDAF